MNSPPFHNEMKASMIPLLYLLPIEDRRMFGFSEKNFKKILKAQKMPKQAVVDWAFYIAICFSFIISDKFVKSYGTF
ncbi:hypothetical protein D3Z38_17455 [Clostridiales bacterium]|nr:hypothetical protein [Clostridiales bacterium]